jgi:pantothenate kinase type III
MINYKKIIESNRKYYSDLLVPLCESEQLDAVDTVKFGVLCGQLYAMDKLLKEIHREESAELDRMYLESRGA